MPTKVFKNTSGDVVTVEHQPGNGTRYLGTAHRIDNGPLGYERQWVVSFPEWGSAYIAREGGYLTLDYVLEKWGMRRTGRRVGAVDASEMAKMIAIMVPGVSVRTVTDDSGRIVEDLAA
jgi:hypothetical protein